MSKLYTNDPVKGKVLVGEIGESKPDTLFLTKTNKHFMRISSSYGIQEDVFDKLLEKGINYIVIHNTETNQRWRGSVEELDKHCKRADYGHGRQVFLSTNYMEKAV